MFIITNKKYLKYILCRVWTELVLNYIWIWALVRNIKTILWYEINDLSHFILWITYYTITSLKFGFQCLVALIQTREMLRDLLKTDKRRFNYINSYLHYYNWLIFKFSHKINNLPIIRHFMWSSMLTSQFWKVFYAYTRHKAVKMILVSRVEDIRKPASTEGEKHISKWFQKVTLNFKEILNFFEGPQAPRDVPDLKPTLEGIMLFSRDLWDIYPPKEQKKPTQLSNK